MRSSDVFSNIDDKTAERLAVGYPVLDSRQKERLYAMSKRKYEIYTDSGSNEVSGVERYRRPKWYKAASIAAAAVLVVAGIGGSTILISHYGTSPAAGTGIAGTETATLSEEQAASIEASVAEENRHIQESIAEDAEKAKAARAEDEQKSIDAVAKGLIDSYREFICDLFAGNLEVDKNNIVTRTIKTDDGQFEYEREFYLVTDQKYPTWADIEKCCYEIFDEEQGQKILEICTEASEDVNGSPFMCVTENGYYIEKGIHDNGMDQLVSSEYDMSAYTDENGNIIASVIETELSKVHDYIIPEKIFTIVNTENGWRINKVDEEDSTPEN